MIFLLFYLVVVVYLSCAETWFYPKFHSTVLLWVRQPCHMRNFNLPLLQLAQIALGVFFSRTAPFSQVQKIQESHNHTLYIISYSICSFIGSSKRCNMKILVQHTLNYQVNGAVTYELRRFCGKRLTCTVMTFLPRLGKEILASILVSCLQDQYWQQTHSKISVLERPWMENITLFCTCKTCYTLYLAQYVYFSDSMCHWDF